MGFDEAYMAALKSKVNKSNRVIRSDMHPWQILERERGLDKIFDALKYYSRREGCTIRTRRMESQ